MKSDNYKTMNHDELTSTYLKHINSINMTLSEYILASAGCDERLGEHAAKIIVDFNKKACEAVAQLYLNELEMGQEADLFKPYLIDLNVCFRVE